MYVCSSTRVKPPLLSRFRAPSPATRIARECQLTHRASPKGDSRRASLPPNSLRVFFSFEACRPQRAEASHNPSVNVILFVQMQHFVRTQLSYLLSLIARMCQTERGGAVLGNGEEQIEQDTDINETDKTCEA